MTDVQITPAVAPKKKPHVVRKATFEAELQFAVVACMKATSRKSTIPILACLRIRQKGKGAIVESTNLDMAITIAVPGKVDKGFDVVVPAHPFAAALRSNKDATEATLTAEEGQLVLSFDKGARTKLQTLPVEDFPDFPDPDYKINFEIPLDDLLLGLSRTAFAISDEETRYYLNGVYLHCADSRAGVKLKEPVLRFVSTDGSRLAQQDVKRPPFASKMPPSIIPRETVRTILALLKPGKSAKVWQISVHHENARMVMRFSSGGTEIETKLIDGTFPDYTRVLPQSNDKALVVNADALSKAAAAASVPSSERKDPSIVLELAKGKPVRLSSSNPGTGAAEATCEGGTYEGDPLRIGFNSRYLRDALGFVEEAVITFRDPGSPALIVGHGDDTWLSALMPVRV